VDLAIILGLGWGEAVDMERYAVAAAVCGRCYSWEVECGRRVEQEEKGGEQTSC